MVKDGGGILRKSKKGCLCVSEPCRRNIILQWASTSSMLGPSGLRKHSAKGRQVN